MAFESLSITGSLFGTASRALSASFVLTGSTLVFPFTGSADVIGVLQINNQAIVPSRVGNLLQNSSAGQTMSSGSFIGLTGAQNTGGGYSIASNRFTLAANQTYYLEADVTQTWLGGTNVIVYEWTDLAGNPVGTIRTQGYMSPHLSNVTSYSGSMATAIVTPTASLNVYVRVTSGSGTMNMGWNGLIGRVQRIG